MSRREGFLRALAGVVTRRAGAVVAAAVVLAGLSIEEALFHLDLSADQNALVSESQGFHHRYRSFLREFGDLEYIYAVLEAPTRERGMAAADALAARLESLDEIREVVARFDLRALGPRALLYQDGEELEAILRELERDGSPLRAAAGAGSVDDLFDRLSGAIERDAVKARGAAESLGGLGTFTAILNALGDALEGEEGELPPLDALVGTPEDRSREYLFSPDGSLLFVLILPRKDFGSLSVIEGPLARIRAAAGDVRAHFPDVSIGLTGRPVLQADEMRTTSRDMKLAAVLSFVGVILIFALAYRQVLAPLLAAAALATGIAWTFGLATVAIGSLNLLSMVFALILVGLGIDFGIHFVTRFVRVRARARDLEEAVEATLAGTGKAILTGALTSALAFLAAMLTGFLGLAQLGFIAGTGLLLCLVSMLVVLPALLCLAERRFGPVRLPHRLEHPIFRAERLHRRPAWLLGLAAAVTAAAAPGLLRVRFDENLLELQAPALESVAYERKIMEASDRSTWYAASLAGSYDEALRRAEAFRCLEVVRKVETVGDAMPSRPEEKRALLARIAAIVARRRGPRPPRPPDLDRLIRRIRAWRARTALFARAIAAAGAGAAERVEALRRACDRVLGSTDAAGRERIERVARFQARLFAALDDALGAFGRAAEEGPFSPDELPPRLLRRYRSPKGTYLVYIYPRDDIWEAEPMAAFVSAIRRVDPDVTGTPIVVFEASRLMRRSFLQVAMYATVAVVLVVLLDFRALGWVLLSLVPVAAGILWLVELMGLVGLAFSLANFFAVPILIGIGVDNGVHLIHGYREHRSTPETLGSTGVAVVISSLTTFLSFGALATASHRGLASLGLIMALGVLACLGGAFFVLAPLLEVLSRRRERPHPGEEGARDPRKAAGDRAAETPRIHERA